MPEPPNNNLCLPVKRLKNIIARVKGYGEGGDRNFGSGEINPFFFFCWSHAEVKLKIQEYNLNPGGLLISQCRFSIPRTNLLLRLGMAQAIAYIQAFVFFFSSSSKYGGFSPAGTAAVTTERQVHIWLLKGSFCCYFRT